MSRINARVLGRAFLAGMVLFGSTRGAEAQACIGNPGLQGQVSIGAGASFTDGATGYGGGLQMNLVGPLAVGGYVEILDVDDPGRNATGVSASLAYELPVQGVSACPLLGATYASWGERGNSSDVDVSRIAVPLGVGVGVLLELENHLTLIPSASVQQVYLYDRTSLSRGGVRFYSSTQMDTAIFGSMGATLGIYLFFVRGSISFSTEDGSDPVFGILAGFRF